MNRSLIAQHLPVTIIFEMSESAGATIALSPRDGNFRLRTSALPAVIELISLTLKDIRLDTSVDSIYYLLLEAIIYSACYRSAPPSWSERPDTWTRFLSENERGVLDMMVADMDFLFQRFAAGDPAFSEFELTSFRREFNSVTRS